MRSGIEGGGISFPIPPPRTCAVFCASETVGCVGENKMEGGMRDGSMCGCGMWDDKKKQPISITRG